MISFADYIETLPPKDRVEVIKQLAATFSVTSAAISRWKRLNEVPRYAHKKIKELAPGVEFDFETQKQVA